MAEDVTIPLPGQIKIRMVGEVDHRRLVRAGGKLQLQFVVVGQGVQGRDFQVAGKAFLPILAHVSQHQLRPMNPERGARGPDDLVKALDAAMQ